MLGVGTNALSRVIEKRVATLFPEKGPVGFAVQLDGGARTIKIGSEPSFTLVVKDGRGLSALKSLDLNQVGEAYLSGWIDVKGDLLKLLAMREMFSDRHPLKYLMRFVRPLLFGQARSDKAWISQHYDTSPDFFLMFLDTAHRCYSHGVFETDSESLETGIRRKLDYALNAVNAKPGDRILDIGGGWGAMTQYAGRKGIRITSITISKESEKFLVDLIAKDQLPSTVVREHLYEHNPAKKYDAILNLGVTEHLPDYERSLEKYESLLKPGGKVYLDASASRRKYAVSSFAEKHVFPGNGSPMCLHDYLDAVSKSPFEVETVLNDRHNYYLTTKAWAERLDSHREEIENRWGLAQYRRFQLYLWACVDGFTRDSIQAYRVVLKLRTLMNCSG